MHEDTQSDHNKSSSLTVVFIRNPCLDDYLVTVFRYSEILFHIKTETCLFVVLFCFFQNVVTTWTIPPKNARNNTVLMKTYRLN